MLTVSNYHYIREDFTSKYPSIFGVTPASFKKQLLLLKNEGEYISVNELMAHPKEICQSKDSFFLITFDDGLKEQVNYALPILDSLNIPAIFFANSLNNEKRVVSTVHKIHYLRSFVSPKVILDDLITNQVTVELSDLDEQKAIKTYRFDDKENAILKYILNFKIPVLDREIIIGNIFKKYFEEAAVYEKLYMSNNDLISLAERGSLGSHTHNHYPLGLLSSEEIQFELEQSKLILETLTSTKIHTVAYPYGTKEACTDEVSDIAKDVGYKIGFTTQKGVNNKVDDYLRMNRFDCNDLIGGKNFK